MLKSTRKKIIKSLLGIVIGFHYVKRMIIAHTTATLYTPLLQIDASDYGIITPLVHNYLDPISLRPHVNCRRKIEKEHFTLIDKWFEDELPILDYVIEIDDNLIAFFVMKHFTYRPFNESKFNEVVWYCASGNGIDTLATSMYLKKDRLIRVYCQLRTTKIWTKTFTSITGGNNMSESYDIESLIQCDKLDQIEDSSIIQKDTKIGACLEIRGNRHLLPQWIEYHRMIGFQHFWIFVNEEWSTEGLPNKPYITYIPFNYYHDDHKNHSHWTNDGSFFWQIPMQMQCIYRMKRLNLDWVTTTDVDEYVYLNLTQKEEENQTEEVPTLKKYLSSVDNYEQIGALSMNSISFGRNELVDPKNSTYPLLIDYIWRPKYSQQSRMKMIYNPRNVISVGPHFLYSGGFVKLGRLELYIQHYKKPQNGVYRSRGSPLVKDTNLSNKYREKLIKAL